MRYAQVICGGSFAKGTSVDARARIGGLVGRGVWEHHLHCPGEEEFNEIGLYVEDQFLEAKLDINSSAVVPIELDVSYRAGNQVHLTPGFHASSGARFHAFIHPCDIPGNSLRPKAVATNLDVGEADTISIIPVDLRVYPNPATGAFTVHSDFLTERGSGTVRLYDPTGKLVLSTIMRGQEQRYTGDDLHGLFMVVVAGNGEQRSCKLLLE